MGNELRGAWSATLNHPPRLLWPILSDTERFNEMSGLPRYVLSETPQQDGSVRRVASGRAARFDVQWEELPVEWVEEQYFTQTRLFLNGPLARMTATLKLAAQGDGSKLSYHIEIETRHAVIGPYVAGRLIRGAGRTFARAVNGAGEFLDGMRPSAYELEPPVLVEGGEGRAKSILSYLQTGPYDHGLSARLVERLLHAPDADMCHIRPKQLAREWDVEPRYVVELCLAGVRSGLLRLTWDLLCPRCRGAKATAPQLDQLGQTVHCPSCNIDYTSDFAKNVELVFHPAATVRECPGGEYCLSGPQTTPHVLVQQSLQPGETKELAAEIAPGEYRLRTLSRGAEFDISHAGGAFPAMIVSEDGVTVRSPDAPGNIVLVNDTQRPLTLLIESREWVKDALTAHQVTTMHTFRHLFPDQVLRAGEEMSIDNVTLMFTDLQESTMLYRQIGDGPAYHRVREHFGFLIEIVRAHNGALVKTIGDAVMAAFAGPAPAVRAALAVQQNIAEFNRGHSDTEIHLKMGLHGGRCIVVNLNDRLDYFGSTVNLAARLQGQSRGGDIIISDELASDPVVAGIIAPLRATREMAELKGYDRAIPFLRIAALSD